MDYLAGAISGNLGRWYWENEIIHSSIMHSVGGGEMKLYIAGDNGYAKGEENINQLNNENKLKRINILESFFYIQEWQKPLIKQCKSFMLDSGAFTFMVKPNVKLDWDSYIERYADFINENDVKLFFELDIDSIVGYEQVKV